MLFTHKELKKILGSNYKINKKLSDKELYKITGGLYSNKEINDSLALASKKYPNGVITMDSAFYYYDLTDVIPKKIHIATKMHSYLINDENVKQIFVSDNLFELGKEEIIIDGERIFIYDKERLLIELVRKRNKISFDYYKEIINNYRKIVNELNMNKLETYLTNFNSEDKIFEIIMKEVF